MCQKTQRKKNLLQLAFTSSDIFSHPKSAVLTFMATRKSTTWPCCTQGCNPTIAVLTYPTLVGAGILQWPQAQAHLRACQQWMQIGKPVVPRQACWVTRTGTEAGGDGGTGHFVGSVIDSATHHLLPLSVPEISMALWRWRNWVRTRLCIRGKCSTSRCLMQS